MTTKPFDLMIAGALAITALALTLLGIDIPVLRLLLGLLLVLALPGYALSAALFPRSDLAVADRALYTLSISLSAVILSGFLLHNSPWGLRPDSWAVMLAYLTLAGCLVAFARRYMIPLEPIVEARVSRRSLKLNPGQVLLFGLAIGVVAGAVLLARFEATRQPAADTIQLWMLPGEGASAPGVRVGINSVGRAGGTFRLEILHNGQIIHEWPELEIASGQHWEEALSLPRHLEGTGPIEARLYRADERESVYRHAIVWVNV